MPSLYDITVPPFIKSLEAMAKFLEKGRAYGEEQGWAEDELIEARLYPDMGALTAQIQRATDSAKFLAVRVGGVENKPFPDEEKSFADLADRIAGTIAFLKAAPREGFDGKEEAEVVLTTPSRSVTFTGQSYVTNFVVPNFYFHITAAYAILRMKGVPVGKLDYLGAG